MLRHFHSYFVYRVVTLESKTSHPSPNQEPINSERKLVCGDWHPSENTDHPTHLHTWHLVCCFDLPFLKMEVSRMVSIG